MVMNDLTASGAALLGAGIAAAATVIGTVLAFLLQYRLASRQRKWAIADEEARREHELAMRDAERREHRFLTLRAERRETYGRFLDQAHEYIAAIKDLRDAGLPADVQVTSTVDVEAAHPIAARALRAMDAQRRRDSDLDLIADSEVRIAARALSDALRHAFRDAVEQKDGLKDAYRLYHMTVEMMRCELIGLPSTGGSESDRGAEPPSEGGAVGGALDLK